MTVERKFTAAGEGPYRGIRWERRNSRISDPGGGTVFEMEGVEVPSRWSEVAADILASKYFRKAGVPQTDEEGATLVDEGGSPILGGETSARAVFSRLAETWRHWGEREGYFATAADGDAFCDELKYMLSRQMGAPNSPQWFNTGLHYKYGITGPPQGFWYVDPSTGEERPSEDAYSRPAPHACFIQSVKDDLVNEGGIMDLWTREARLFKMGSGTGTNFSTLRAEGEPLSGGGKSSGLMSFLKIGDRAAGAVKSGGTTRRAAKMVVLDVDHPDIEEFADWKRTEEEKARTLIEHGGYPPDFNGEAYATVSGQNSNNSVRVTKEFLDAVREDRDWPLRGRITGEVMKEVSARDLWERITEAAWACADPGIQFHTTINEWHTCPGGGEIRASNPCSEYMFLDDTACNLASINLASFWDEEKGEFDVDAFRHAIRLWTMVLEISVAMAHFPSRAIARGSYDYRTLGLGYANLGSLLMRMGLPYDSDEGRAVAAAITAILGGEAYATSAEMARRKGPFPKFGDNRESMLRVMRNHRRAAYGAPQDQYEGIGHYVPPLRDADCPPYLAAAARDAWDTALEEGLKHGFRNAQVTVLAPTGTIGLVMDCDTTGIEPDYALVKHKKLAGGGSFVIANSALGPALRRLGYEKREVAEILAYVGGTRTLREVPHVNHAALVDKGMYPSETARVERALAGAASIEEGFSPGVLGEEALARIGAEGAYSGEEVLTSLGFSPAEIRAASAAVCGHHSIEGAPHLRNEHLAVFDTAGRNGEGERFIRYEGHIAMMAAAQPFISGAISKTINMPTEAAPEDISDAYLNSAELGIKAMAVYRDGCKASQPLSGASPAKAKGTPPPAPEEPVSPNGGAPSPRGSHPRFLLPAKRGGWTREARIGGHKVFLRTGEYPDGALGEIFLDLAKEGATLRGVLGCFAIAVSKGLQYGVPLEEFVDTFAYQTFEPRGVVENHPHIKMASSIIDYVFRTLGIEYLERDDLAQVPPERNPAPPEREPLPLGNTPSPNGAPVPAPAPVGAGVPARSGAVSAPVAAVSPLEGAYRTKGFPPQGEAPLCPSCGHLTHANGSCFVCRVCGETTGCS